MLGRWTRRAAALSIAVVVSGCAAFRDEAYVPTQFTASSRYDATPLTPLPPLTSPQRVASMPAEDFQCVDGSVLQVTYSPSSDVANLRVNGGAPIQMQRSDEGGLAAYRSEGLVLRRSGVRAALTSGEATVTVRAGDTLGAIALRAYGDRTRVAEIARENGLANPDLILVGQVLRLAVVERTCRRSMVEAASYAPDPSAAPSAVLDRRLFSAPSRRQPDLRNVQATSVDPQPH